MFEPDVNRGLQQEDLFELFRLQLKKDFESCGLDATFTDGLPSIFEELQKIILKQVEYLLSGGSQYFAGLLGAGIAEASENATNLEKLNTYADGYYQLGLYALIAGVVLIVISPLVRKLMQDVK